MKHLSHPALAEALAQLVAFLQRHRLDDGGRIVDVAQALRCRRIEERIGKGLGLLDASADLGRQLRTFDGQRPQEVLPFLALQLRRRQDGFVQLKALIRRAHAVAPSSPRSQIWTAFQSRARVRGVTSRICADSSTDSPAK